MPFAILVKHWLSMASSSKKSIYLVCGCTVFAAVAQVLMKFGAANEMPKLDMTNPGNWIPFILAIIANLPLFLGYCTSAGTAVLLILALRDGELSTLYPIISLSYVWVNLLSMYFFHDRMNIWKVAGIAFIIGGVGLLGRAGSKQAAEIATEATLP
jgi:drug/metabolite transporter (DMT)-like permease